MVSFARAETHENPSDDVPREPGATSGGGLTDIYGPDQNDLIILPKKRYSSSEIANYEASTTLILSAYYQVSG